MRIAVILLIGLLSFVQQAPASTSVTIAVKPHNCPESLKIEVKPGTEPGTYLYTVKLEGLPFADSAQELRSEATALLYEGESDSRSHSPREVEIAGDHYVCRLVVDQSEVHSLVLLLTTKVIRTTDGPAPFGRKSYLLILADFLPPADDLTKGEDQ